MIPSNLQLLDLAIAGAITGQVYGPVGLNERPDSLALFCDFAYGSGGTTVKAWVQTSLDGGLSWIDIASFAFTTTAGKRAYHLTGAAVTSIATPSDGSLSDNTAVNGLLGAQLRVKVTTTGTYAGATGLKVWASPK
jgi:hypothetical protein